MTKTTEPQRIVKKHAAAIHTSGELSLLERKLVNILLLNAYDRLLTDTTHSIPVSILLDMLGWDNSGDIDYLKAALVNIQKTILQYDLLNRQGQNKKWAASSLLAFAQIEKGICTYQYSQFLAAELANPEIYAQINLGVQNQFKGGYALTLYENCVRFKRVGSTGWIAVDLWRRLLGADSTRYDDFKHLSKEVIKRSVSEVNKVSDIEISPEYQREMRKVTNIRFSVKDNPQQSIFDSGEVDDSAIRESDVFKRLLALGIGEKLALVWMAQDPARAEKAVRHVESIESARGLHNPAGYIRTVFESGGAIGAESPAKEQKAAKVAAAVQATAQDDAQQTAREIAIKEAIKALSIEQLRAFAASYVAGAGSSCSSSYNPETGKFKSALERVQFTSWLRSQVKPA